MSIQHRTGPLRPPLPTGPGWRAAALALASLLASTAWAAPPRPAIVELYTSEGCSSCPPAEALIEKLATQPGVLPLAFHVDYWDQLGWRDPFSSAQFTRRQQQYSRALGGEVAKHVVCARTARAAFGREKLCQNGHALGFGERRAQQDERG